MTNSSNPLISFVLLAYKQEKYIREAVEGAFAQTYSPLEIILSDDASPDGTFEIIQEMAAAYQGPHKLILNRNEKNLGIGPHVKKIFEIASGEWLVGAAGDDISLPQRCTSLMAAAMKAVPTCMGVASNWVDIDEAGNLMAKDSGASIWHAGQTGVRWENGIKGCLNVLCHGTMLLPGCSAMWNTRLIRDWPAFSEKLVFEDVALSCRAHLCGTMTLIEDVLLQYRQTPGAVTNQSAEADPEKRREQAARTRKTRLSRLVCFDQFVSDLEHLECTRGTPLPGRDLVAAILAHKTLEQLKLDWPERTTIQRVREIAAGRYPFGRLRPATMLHVLPPVARERLQRLLQS